ncbi:MAG: c-type cytochrome [Calditrichaeota bacterium]|nr:c-type cytochrome [Calditrichota bacterium]
MNENDDKLLDHEYDGIRELDNSLPNWWLNGFYFTIFFGIGYLLLYHVFGWAPDQKTEYRNEMVSAFAKYNPSEYRAKITGTEMARVPKNEFKFTVLTDQASIDAGRKIFLKPQQLCFTCHGQNGEGLVGPNLTDEYWLKGCDIDSIVKSIRTGAPEKGMLPYGSGQKLSDQELQQLASFIISLQGSNPANAKAPDLTRAVKCETGS